MDRYTPKGKNFKYGEPKTLLVYADMLEIDAIEEQCVSGGNETTSLSCFTLKLRTLT